MATDVGLFPEYTFHIYEGKTFAIDAKWWLDTAKTQPAIITSAKGRIKDSDRVTAATLFDLAPLFVGNVVQIRMTPEQTLALTATGGYMEVEARSATETVIVARGRVVIHPEVSE